MKKGSKQSLSSRAAISIKMKGKPKTPQQREKMANARTAWWARKKKVEEAARNARYAIEAVMKEANKPLIYEPIVDVGEPQSETVTHKRPEFR